MASGQEAAAPHILQRDTAEGERGEVIPHRYPDGADGARPKHGVLLGCEYGLLAPEDPAGDPVAAGPQGSGYRPNDTTGTGGTDGS